MKVEQIIFLVTGVLVSNATAWPKGTQPASTVSAGEQSASAANPSSEMALPLLGKQTQGLPEGLPQVNIPSHLKGFEKQVGSRQRGLALLTNRLSCLDCHSIVPGEDTGFPNLSDVGRRLSTQQIVTSILEPSREIAGGKVIRLLTTDGRVIEGIEIVTNNKVVVVRNGDATRAVQRDRIEQMVTTQSDMPAGQADDLNPQQFADLIAFLSSLGR